MPTDIEAFAETLNDEDRTTLFGSVTFVLDVVARADHSVDRKESAAIDQLRESAGSRLGPAFAAPASQFEEAGKAAAHFEWPSHPYLKRLGTIARKMPPATKTAYGNALLDLMLGVGGASGGILSFGKKLSDHERYAVNRVIAALDLEVSDDVKKRLG
jgi:hypothetical protein